MIARVEAGATLPNVAASAAPRPRSANRREARALSVFVRLSKRSASIRALVPHTRSTTGVARQMQQIVAGLPTSSIACGCGRRDLARQGTGQIYRRGGNDSGGLSDSPRVGAEGASGGVPQTSRTQMKS